VQILIRSAPQRNPSSFSSSSTGTSQYGTVRTLLHTPCGGGCESALFPFMHRCRKRLRILYEDQPIACFGALFRPMAFGGGYFVALKSLSSVEKVLTTDPNPKISPLFVISLLHPLLKIVAVFSFPFRILDSSSFCLSKMLSFRVLICLGSLFSLVYAQANLNDTIDSSSCIAP